ncbi:MAG: glycoside hydrolase family 20 zincin-like fold domain-containing protein, partial [Paramuribaculum sp.]|nr:glycoside hydrolase family 20 zincin-like fold domain-containing protein [Paramuribaculum sp.]
MKKILLPILVLCSGLYAAAQSGIIPKPKSVEPSTGSLTIKPGAPIAVRADKNNAANLARYAAGWLPLKPTSGSARGGVAMEIVEALPQISSPEGYVLTVTPDSVTIKATEPQGLFYGLVTLSGLA